jgi:hypothetical protein
MSYTYTKHLRERLEALIMEAERKALDNLKRYKFQNFGYYAARWVVLVRLSGRKRPNPFKDLVHVAGRIYSERWQAGKS